MSERRKCLVSGSWPEVLENKGESLGLAVQNLWSRRGVECVANIFSRWLEAGKTVWGMKSLRRREDRRAA